VFARTHVASRTEKGTTEIHAVLNAALKPPIIATIMVKNLVWVFVVAIASLSIVNYAQAQNKTLTPEVTQLQWDGWLVKIDDLQFSSSIEHYGVKKAGADSIFVHLSMTVRNNKNHGETFIPQNALKIVIGGNEYDAQDLDVGAVSYMGNIEPTLVRDRLCYFELPTSQVGNSLTLRFKQWLTEEKTVKVAIADAPRPPIPSPTPEEYATQQQMTDFETNQKFVSAPAPTPFKLSKESAESDLAHAWKSLTPEQRDQLNQEERNWVRHRDSLPAEERIKSTAQRAKYIWSLVSRTFDD
jgi:hypothetical protein